MVVGVFGDNSPPDALTDQEIRALIGETAIAFYKGLHDARMVTLHKKLVFWEGLPETKQALTPRPTLNAARDLPVWVECLNLTKIHVMMVLRLATDPDQPAIPPEVLVAPGLPNP